MPSKEFVDVLDARMAYSDMGQGDPILLLHGNPMHGFLWHSLVPHTESLGRLVVPDLIGMGDSARPDPSDPDRYLLSNHIRYLDEFLEVIGVTDNVIVVGGGRHFS